MDNIGCNHEIQKSRLKEIEVKYYYIFSRQKV